MASKIDKYLIRFTAGAKAPSTESFDFSKEELTIGREENCDIRFDPLFILLEMGVQTAQAQVLREPMHISSEVTIDSAGNGIFEMSGKLNAQQWQTWNYAYGAGIASG